MFEWSLSNFANIEYKMDLNHLNAADLYNYIFYIFYKNVLLITEGQKGRDPAAADVSKSVVKSLNIGYNSNKREYYIDYIGESFPVYARVGRLRRDQSKRFLFLLS